MKEPGTNGGTDTMEITWFGHSSIGVVVGSESLFFDPIRENKMLSTCLKPTRKATAIFLSHEHWDHCDDVTVRSIGNLKTKIIGPKKALANLFFPSLTFELESVQEMESFFSKKNPYVHHVTSGDHIHLEGCAVRCLPSSEGLAYLIEGKKNILFMGDSVANSEMIDTKPDVILFPVWAVRGEEADLDMFIKFPDEALYLPMHYHTSKKGLANFYVQEEELKKLLPESKNIRIMQRKTPLYI